MLSGEEKDTTAFFSALATDAKNLMEKALTDEIKEECCKVYNTIRSSAILGLEISTAQVNNIKISFFVFAYSVKYSSIEDIKTAADDLISLLAP